MAAHLYIHALYEVYTYSNLISAACTSPIRCVRTTHDPGYVVWFIRPVIIRVKGNYPCATTAAIFDLQNPCNCGGVFTLSMRHRSLLRTSQDYFRPPPPRFKEEMDSIYVHFRRVFVGFVVLLTKIWPTNNDFLAIQLNVGERAVQRAGFGPPPFHTKK